MLEHPIVDAAVDLLTTGPAGLRLLPANQAALAERLSAESSLIDATCALFMLVVRLDKRGHRAAAADVAAVAKSAKDALPKHLDAATRRHQRMLADFSRVCDRSSTLRAPVYGNDAALDGGFKIRSMPRAKLR